MNISNFHQHIPNKILERGEEYFECDLIEKVEHHNSGIWTADVQGSYIYSIEIETNGDEVLSWHCDCPYDYGDICKHVVAMLFYIRENKEMYPTSIEVLSATSPEHEELSEILKQTDPQKLETFILQYADENPAFHQALRISQHPKNHTGTRKDYLKEIQQCFTHSNRYYNYRDGENSIADGLDNYIHKAKSLIKLNCQEEALNILLHIIREIGNNYEEYEDYNGDLACVCQEAAELMIEMIEAGLPDNLLNTLTDNVELLIKNSNYDNYELADLEQIVILLSIKTANYDESIRIIDETIKAEPNSFRTSSLLKSKLELLEKSNREKEIEKTIDEYLYLPDIRKIKLRNFTAKKQYEDALHLIDEGIKIAEKEKHPGTVSDWKDEKLLIYKAIGNKKEIIELAEDLFDNGRDSMAYYRILKTTISSEKWASYLDDFLHRSDKKIYGHTLARIYIEEGFWDRLMDYVEKNVHLGKYSSLAEYEPYLKSRFPERMLDFYRRQITDYAAKNMGREHYVYVANTLKMMRKYPVGNKIADMLLEQFKSTYSNRRAMMEELRQ